MARPTNILRAVAGLAVAAAVAGCAAEGATYGDPGARSLPSGQSCQSIRAELDRLDAHGARGKVESATAGRRLAPKDQADVDRYNQLLNYYLGARCQV